MSWQKLLLNLVFTNTTLGNVANLEFSDDFRAIEINYFIQIRLILETKFGENSLVPSLIKRY